MARSRSDKFSRSGKYRIGAVSRMTGITTHALRVWERRYPTVLPARTKANGRLYSDSDVARLRVIRQLLDKGHSISQIIGLSLEELTRTLITHGDGVRDGDVPLPPLPDLAPTFLSLVFSLKLVEAEQLLSRAAVALDPREVVTRVVIPVLDAICSRWEKGELRWVHERAAISILRALLGRLTRLLIPSRPARIAVAATLAGEPHEFGALLLAFMATLHGWCVVYLGPGVAAQDVLDGVRAGRAEAVLLSVISEENGQAFGDLKDLLDGLPVRVDLYLSGRAAERYRALVTARGTVIRDMHDLEAHLSLPDDGGAVARTADKCSM